MNWRGGCRIGLVLVLVGCSGENPRSATDGFAAGGATGGVDAQDSSASDRGAETPDCACEEGYQQDAQGNCVDIDECALGSHTCDKAHGFCTNTAGRFGCACDIGSVGDGLFCKADAHCEPDSCENGGSCIETLEAPGFSCRCPLGTTGRDCADTESCSSSLVLNSPNEPLLEDRVLRTKLESLLGVSPGQPLTVGDLSGLYSLEVSPPTDEDAAVRSLRGLECWTTLEVLKLPGHQVSDLEPLKHLSLLLELDLSCNPLSSLTPLSDHVLMQSLDISLSDSCPAVSLLEENDALSTLVGLTSLNIEGQGVGPEALVSLPQLRPERICPASK